MPRCFLAKSKHDHHQRPVDGSKWDETAQSSASMSASSAASRHHDEQRRSLVGAISAAQAVKSIQEPLRIKPEPPMTPMTPMLPHHLATLKLPTEPLSMTISQTSSSSLLPRVPLPPAAVALSSSSTSTNTTSPPPRCPLVRKTTTTSSATHATTMTTEIKQEVEEETVDPSRARGRQHGEQQHII